MMQQAPERSVPAQVGFSQGQVSQTRIETAATSAAAYARALVEARVVMALRNPRDIDEARQRLLRECKRPRFAELAEWERPVGSEQITGPTIRLVEAALAAYRNVAVDSTVVSESDDERIVRVVVIDAETNVSWARDVTVAKRVERNSLRKGQQAIATRVNSKGRTVYIVEATDDDLVAKEAALVSKAARTLGMRVLPGWLMDEALETCRATAAAASKADPDLARRKLVDSFAALSIGAAQLREYLGHPVEQVTPDEVAQLRRVFAALKDGDTTWGTVMQERRQAAQDRAAPATAEPAASSTAAPGGATTERQTAPAAADASPAKVSVEEIPVEDAPAAGKKPRARRGKSADSAAEQVEDEIDVERRTVLAMAEAVGVQWAEMAERLARQGLNVQAVGHVPLAQLRSLRAWLRVSKGAGDPIAGVHGVGFEAPPAVEGDS